MEHLWTREGLDDRAFLEGFLEMAGASPEEMLEVWAGRVSLLRECRQPVEADIPLDQLASAPFPKLVVSADIIRRSTLYVTS